MSSRRTKVQMEEFREAIRAIVAADPPMTCRQTFYQAVGQSLVEKTESGSDQVNGALRWLRRAGELDWSDIVDNTRSVQLPAQWDSVGAWLADSEDYQRDFWQDRSDRPAILIEKDALAGVVEPITAKWGVPLLPLRGDPSDTSLYELSLHYLTDESTVYVFTDLDYKGEGSIFQKIGEKLSEFFDCNATVERIALTPAQVKQYNLPKRPPKKGKRKYAVELDALPKAILQQLVEACILNHVDADEWQQHLAQEEADRQRLIAIAKREARKSA